MDYKPSKALNLLFKIMIQIGIEPKETEFSFVERHLGNISDRRFLAYSNSTNFKLEIDDIIETIAETDRSIQKKFGCNAFTLYLRGNAFGLTIKDKDSQFSTAVLLVLAHRSLLLNFKEVSKMAGKAKNYQMFVQMNIQAAKCSEDTKKAPAVYANDNLDE